MKKYLIDSNSLISPYKTFYQFELVPSFWEWLKPVYDQSIFLVDKVRDELRPAKKSKDKDELQKWIETNCLAEEKIILPNTDIEVLNNYAKVLNHVDQSPFYKQKSYDLWADFKKADPWLIAIALTHGYTIVTMEVRNTHLGSGPATSKEPKIPDVCNALGVECINLYDLMHDHNCSI
ncbi:hypothetical protein B795N_05170 [Marinilactibacillus psychrotolerans]|uniref:DUF4411 family protein n=1 Tax=Marinilactibacillus psychrotolerans TaxID=191770 RepID=UPI001C7DDD32|nr:DUF4411 family protein [Marinilactibacillus psychrotolerans]GEQ32635.1 hypothetical protein B795N_05170 [Marinilactibacillus psychrotolerans]